MGNFGPQFQPTPPQFYFAGEVVWLLRNGSNEHTLTFQSNGTPPYFGKNVLDTNDLGFQYEPGMRLTLGMMVTRDTAIEGGYYGLNDWDARQGVTGPPGSLAPYWSLGTGAPNEQGFLGTNRQVATASSSFDSAEIGLRHWFNPNVSTLLGFRYINVADQFQLTGFNSSLGPSPSGIYRTWTNNNLFGAQLGFQYKHDVFVNWLSASVEARSGAFANDADQKNLFFSAATPTTSETNSQREARETTFAGMGELTFAMTAHVTNYFSLRGGYTFLFLDGIALAPDQLDSSPTAANSRNFIADKGSMTLQGPFVGGEVTW